MSDKLDFTICDPCGHPWICMVPKKFISSEIKRFRKKIGRENLKVRKTHPKDLEKVEIWTFEKYLKRIEKEKAKKLLKIKKSKP